MDASNKRTQRSASEALAAVDQSFRLLALAISWFKNDSMSFFTVLLTFWKKTMFWSAILYLLSEIIYCTEELLCFISKSKLIKVSKVLVKQFVK